MPHVAVPTPYNFLARFLKAAGACRDKEVLLYASYLTELALPDYAMLKFSYSQTAAAAVYVANRRAKALSARPMVSSAAAPLLCLPGALHRVCRLPSDCAAMTSPALRACHMLWSSW